MARQSILSFILGAVLASAGFLYVEAHPKPAPPPPAPFTISPAQLAVRIHVGNDVDAIRARTIREVFGGPLPTDEPSDARPVPPALGAASMVAFPDGGFLLSTAHPTGRLAIYHAGHAQHALVDGGDASLLTRPHGAAGAMAGAAEQVR